MIRFYKTLFILFLLSNDLSAQNLRVPVEALGERLLAIVPLIGSGTTTNPWRPKHAEAVITQQAIAALAREGKSLPQLPSGPAERIQAEKLAIRSYTFLRSADGKNALVEFVARDRAAFSKIVSDKESQVLERKNLDEPQELERIRKMFPDFDPRSFRAAGL